jgi:hypothetical protein
VCCQAVATPQATSSVEEHRRSPGLADQRGHRLATMWRFANPAWRASRGSMISAPIGAKSDTLRHLCLTANLNPRSNVALAGSSLIRTSGPIRLQSTVMASAKWTTPALCKWTFSVDRPRGRIGAWEIGVG